MDNPDSEIVLYLMLRAVNRFYKQHGRYPGMLTPVTSHHQKKYKDPIVTVVQVINCKYVSCGFVSTVIQLYECEI